MAIGINWNNTDQYLRTGRKSVRRSICGGFVLSVCCLFVSGQSIETNNFFKRPEVKSLKISPDGKSAMAINPHGIAIVRLRDMKRVGGFNYKQAQAEVGMIHWLTDKRIMFESVTYIDGGDQRPFLTGNFFALNINGRKAFRILGGEPDRLYHSLISTLPKDPENILVQGVVPSMTGGINQRPTAYFKNIHRKSSARGSRKVHGGPSPLPNGRLFADNDGQIRIAVGNEYDSYSSRVMYRHDMKSEWIDISARLGGDQDDNITVVSASQNNQSFYFLSRLGGDTRALWRIDESLENPELIHRDPEVDVQMEDLWWDASYTKPVGAVLEKALPTPVIFDARHSATRLHVMLHRSFPGSRVDVTSQSLDGNRGIFRVYSDRDPGEFYVYDLAKSTVDPLGVKVREGIAPEQMTTVRPFSTTSFDEFRIDGYIAIPETTSALPLIVIPHGGPFGIREVWEYDTEMQFFANRGFAVLKLNFRGSGGRGKLFEEAGYQEWGGHMIEDITAAAKWAATLEEIDESSMCIYGSSYGAFAALASVAKEPDLYRCAIGQVGVYDLELMYDKGDIVQRRAGRSFLTRTLGTDSARLREQSPVHHADKIKVPVFLAHGTEDMRAPIQHAYRMRDALEAADVEYEWYLERGEGHGFYSVENQVQLYDKIVSFVRRSIEKDL